MTDRHTLHEVPRPTQAPLAQALRRAGSPRLPTQPSRPYDAGVRKTVAWLLMLVGGGIVLVGVGSALRELGSLYSDIMADPLGQPEGREEAVIPAMLRGVLIGAAGVPILLAGSVMLMASRIRARHARARSRVDRLNARTPL